MFLNTGTLECYPDCFCEGLAPFGILFWTSGAYFLSSLVLYLQVPRRSLEFEFWTFTTITLAISSFLFHATQTLSTVALDYASIVMILLFFPFWRMTARQSRRKKEFLFWLLYISAWVVFYQLSKWARIGLAFTIFTIVMMSVRKEVVRFRFQKNIQAAVILALVSFGFFLSEEFRWICKPHRIFQAHGIWHMGSAIALHLYGRWRFIDQIEESREESKEDPSLR